MNSFTDAFSSTLRLLVTLDPQLLQIAQLSIGVSAAATLIARGAFSAPAWGCCSAPGSR